MQLLDFFDFQAKLSRSASFNIALLESSHADLFNVLMRKQPGTDFASKSLKKVFFSDQANNNTSNSVFVTASNLHTWLLKNTTSNEVATSISSELSSDVIINSTLSLNEEFTYNEFFVEMPKNAALKAEILNMLDRENTIPYSNNLLSARSIATSHPDKSLLDLLWLADVKCLSTFLPDSFVPNSFFSTLNHPAPSIFSDKSLNEGISLTDWDFFFQIKQLIPSIIKCAYLLQTKPARILLVRLSNILKSLNLFPEISDIDKSPSSFSFEELHWRCSFLILENIICAIESAESYHDSLNSMMEVLKIDAHGTESFQLLMDDHHQRCITLQNQLISITSLVKEIQTRLINSLADVNNLELVKNPFIDLSLWINNCQIFLLLVLPLVSQMIPAPKILHKHVKILFQKNQLHVEELRDDKIESEIYTSFRPFFDAVFLLVIFFYIIVSSC